MDSEVTGKASLEQTSSHTSGGAVEYSEATIYLGCAATEIPKIEELLGLTGTTQQLRHGNENRVLWTLARRSAVESSETASEVFESLVSELPSDLDLLRRLREAYSPICELIVSLPGTQTFNLLPKCVERLSNLCIDIVVQVRAVD